MPTAPWKRALDLLGCLAALPLLILCTLALTIVTRLFSPGPVLFRQERVGYQGRRFKIYKFRSMHVHDGPVGRTDSHLMPGARLLRATGLDELPQIINVLRGEMSLVGPRPGLPAETGRYQPWSRGPYTVAALDERRFQGRRS